MFSEVDDRPARDLVSRTGVCALLAVLFAVLLPLAPVLVNEPTVRWPVDPARPTSTLLNLTAYRPAEMDVQFSCRAARAAAELNYSATVVSTVNPVLPEAANLGLIARITNNVDGPELTVDAVGGRLLREKLPAEDCRYRVHGDPAAGLTVSRDDVEVARGPTGVLPDVDVLATSLSALPDATPGDLAVAMRLDDESATSPTLFKAVLIALLVAALIGVGVGLWRLDRAVPRVPVVWKAPRPHPADVAVVLIMLAWLFVAPPTDDDGYYAAMAANFRETGFVGNYYQLYNQSFTPITWFYQLLAWWQTVAGTAPVMQRLLSLVAGLITWCVARIFLSSAMSARTASTGAMGIGMPEGRLARLAVPAVAGVAFLVWWLPLNMGVRPESAVALLGMCALLGVWVAVRRQRLLAAYLACAAAGLALATHTTGFVGMAPLLAGMGGLWALIRVPGGVGGSVGGSAAGGGPSAGLATAGWARARWATAARAVAVISGGATAALAGFADGSLRDFLRAQQIFLDIQPREYWYTEYLRWYFLLGDGAMGNYAKRVAILLALLALAWFLVLSAALPTSGRNGGEAVPSALRLAGWSLIASFGLLWLTPSKWTHHFGAIAGVGPVFLALLLVAAVPLARAVFAGERLPTPVLVAAAGSTLLALALAGHGRNSWPYGWLTGFADVNKAPDVGPFTFGSALGWAVVLAACVLIAWAWVRRDAGREPGADHWRPAALRGVVLFVVAGMLLNLVYLLGSFALAARNTADPDRPDQAWSFWGANVSDPLARRCGAADAVSVYNPFTAQPLDQATGLDPDTALKPDDPETATSAGDLTGPIRRPDDPRSGSARTDSSRSDGTGPGSTGSDGTEPGSTEPDGTGPGSTEPDGTGSANVSGSATANRTRLGGRDDGSRNDSTGFERAGGYYLGYQPPVQLGTGAASTVWGSLTSTDGRPPDRNTGEMRTPWYRLPDGLGPDRAVAVLLAGSANMGNSLAAEYAALDGDRLVRVDEGVGQAQMDNGQTGTQSKAHTAAQRDPSQRDNGQLDPATTHTGDLDDTARDPRWRSVLVNPPRGARLVRLHAVDDSAGAGGWLAFAAPAVQRLQPLRAVLDQVPGRDADRPVALAWQIAFQYPCLRQPRVRNGITEPPGAAVLWAEQPFNGTRDGTWLQFRGGVYGQVLRSQSPLQLTARVRGMPTERRTEVLVFDTALEVGLDNGAYRVTTRERLTSGWSQPVPTPTRTLNELERCVQDAAATANPTAAARCVPKPVP